jgi:hypothetical protein
MRAVLVPVLAAAWLALLPVMPARAVLIEVGPRSQEAVEGEEIQVRLAISGLVDASAPSLSTFDLDVAFDATVLALTTVSFGDPVLGDQLDLFGLGTETLVTPGGGTVNLFELSLDTPADLDDLQAGAFILATLTFEAIGEGNSPLALTVNALGDATGGLLEAELAPGSVRVRADGGAPVAAPVPALLVVLGLIAMNGLTFRTEGQGTRARSGGRARAAPAK